MCARGARRAGVLVPGGSGRGLSASGGRSPPSPFPRGASPALPPPHPAAASASGGTKLERGSLPPPRLPEPKVPPGWVAGGLANSRLRSPGKGGTRRVAGTPPPPSSAGTEPWSPRCALGRRGLTSGPCARARRAKLKLEADLTLK